MPHYSLRLAHWLAAVSITLLWTACSSSSDSPGTTSPAGTDGGGVDGASPDHADSGASLCDPPCGPQGTCCLVDPALPKYACVDLRWDANHCGACGKACPADNEAAFNYCMSGECKASSASIAGGPGSD